MPGISNCWPIGFTKPVLLGSINSTPHLKLYNASLIKRVSEAARRCSRLRPHGARHTPHRVTSRPSVVLSAMTAEPPVFQMKVGAP